MQVLALKQKGLKACFLGSAQTDQRVKEDAWAGQYLYIYCTPELAVNSVARLTHLRDTKVCTLPEGGWGLGGCAKRGGRGERRGRERLQLGKGCLGEEEGGLVLLCQGLCVLHWLCCT